MIISSFNKGKNCKLQFPPIIVCAHPPKGKRKERAMREKERQGSTKGKGGLFKKLQIPTLPPKHPSSGVTFHCLFYFDIPADQNTFKKVNNRFQRSKRNNCPELGPSAKTSEPI